LGTVLANALYLLAMVASVGLALRKSLRGLALLATLAMACSALVWTPMMTPSVDGMRFLPLALLMLAILWGEAAEGSLLVDRQQPGDWLVLFRTGYGVAKERAFGGYTAYRLPK
jgi:hypothetical protein